MDVYQNPSEMEPLLPSDLGGRLSTLSSEILKASGRLAGEVHSPLVIQRVGELVREMNCYYSNLIEGHKTLPRDIERAMKQDFSRDETQRNNQHLSLAHIAVEKLMVKRLEEESVDVLVLLVNLILNSSVICTPAMKMANEWGHTNSDASGPESFVCPHSFANPSHLNCSVTQRPIESRNVSCALLTGRATSSAQKLGSRLLIINVPNPQILCNQQRSNRQ